ncbi:hypothetical protein GJ496_000905 [Pomphorhynchus laevis]|nr:hypothetical protein GJ496_000905 [Pomphorhynchus laevis]
MYLMGNKQKSQQNSTILTNEALQLLLANTRFNEKEIIEWHAGFIRDCPDGKLSESKFKEVSRSLFPNKNIDKLCSLSFKTFDQDGNGFIDFYEFLYAITILQRGNPKN